ncbi:GMC oxidoreductase [Glonium stellatum]|uniref:GMC oxidoreductase n=1 Tax=Glonium stellatum TaxID=574774 RepID=A0A8E2F584_9PEZI|nr:GMC oxidoreductase [Glonium stellatum]
MISGITGIAALALHICSIASAFPQDTAAISSTETYEYVVVGSGPGGGPLAADLARAGHSVLLLEAGDDQTGNLNEEIPAFGAAASEDPTMRWDFFVKHYADNAQALKDSKMVWEMPNGTWYAGLNPPAGSTQLGLYYPRAATLGGCSTHNGGITIYPPKTDWSDIVALTGDTSWNPTNMRQYFEKVERNVYLPKTTPGHGYSGFLAVNILDPAPVESDPELMAITKAAVSVMRNGTVPASNKLSDLLAADLNNIAPNRDSQEDIWQVPIHMDENHKRSSAATYVVATANATHSNGTKMYPLYVQTHSLATKVLFDSTSSIRKHTPKATGVEYLAGESLYRADPRSNSTNLGTIKRVLASREVIISGGTFNSPQLLKLSGIGPKAELAKFNISVLVDSPGVGTNMQDHYETAVISQSPSAFTFFANCTFGATPDDPCLAAWREGKGPYAGSGFPDIITKISSSATSSGIRDLFVYDLTLYFTGFVPGYSRDPGLPGAFTFGILKANASNHAGTVLLRSADPRDVPAINFNYFNASGAAADLRALADGVGLARTVFDRVGAPATPQAELWPGRNVSSVVQVETYVRNEAYSHHATSTCAIGADGDAYAVLDSGFRVRGLSGLRVVDASVFPRSPGTFPVLSVFIISAKAADVILADAAAA